jgi:hypothetical protein
VYGQHGADLLLFRQHRSIHRRADGGSVRRERGHEAPFLEEREREREEEGPGSVMCPSLIN